MACAISLGLIPAAVAHAQSGVYQFQVTQEGVVGPGIPSTGGGATPPPPVPRAYLVANPSVLSFGVQPAGSVSRRVVKLTNTGNGPSTAVHAAVSGNSALSLVSTTCSNVLASGESCEATIAFAAPAADYSIKSGSLAFTGSPALAPVGVSGASQAPSLTYSAASLDLGRVAVGASSVTGSFTLTNPTSSPAYIEGLGITENTAEFAQSNDCGGTLAAGTACTVNVSMTPIAGGLRTGSVGIVSAAGSQVVALRGIGQQAVLVADMASQTIGTVTLGASASRSYTVTNTGELAARLAYTALSAPVTRSGSCATELSPNASCTVVLTYAPTVASGASTYTVTVSAPGTSVALTAIGAGFNPGQSAIEAVAYHPGQPYIAPTPAAPGQPYIAPTPAAPGQPYIAPVPYNPGQPYIAAVAYNPGQSYVAPSGWVAPTSRYSGGVLNFSSYVLDNTAGNYSGLPAFTSGGSAGSKANGTTVVRWEGLQSGGLWYRISSTYTVTGAKLTETTPGYYTNPGRPYIAPTPATPGQPYIAPTPATPGQPYIAPTPYDPGQPYIAPTPYNPGQPYIAPTPATEGRPYIAPSGGM